MKVFVGGSKTVSALTADMLSAIDDLCSLNAEILLGDCFGADKLARDADCGLMFRNGKTRGTLRNITDLKAMRKKCTVFFCHNLKSAEHANRRTEGITETAVSGNGNPLMR